MRNTLAIFPNVQPIDDNFEVQDFSDFASLKFPDTFTTDVSYFELYQLPDDIKPETIADSVYGDVNKHDISTIFNWADPIFDYPKSFDILSQRNLHEYSKFLFFSGLDETNPITHANKLRIENEIQAENETYRNLKVPYVGKLQELATWSKNNALTSLIPNIAEYQPVISTDTVASASQVTIAATKISSSNENLEYDILVRQNGMFELTYAPSQLLSVTSLIYGEYADCTILENIVTIPSNQLMYGSVSRKQYVTCDIPTVSVGTYGLSMTFSDGTSQSFSVEALSGETKTDIFNKFVAIQDPYIVFSIDTNGHLKIMIMDELISFQVDGYSGLVQNEQNIILTPYISVGNPIVYELIFDDYLAFSYTSTANQSASDILDGLATLITNQTGLLVLTNGNSLSVLSSVGNAFDFTDATNITISYKTIQQQILQYVDVDYKYIPKIQKLEFIPDGSLGLYSIFLNNNTYSYTLTDVADYALIAVNLASQIYAQDSNFEINTDNGILTLTSKIFGSRFIVNKTDNFNLNESFLGYSPTSSICSGGNVAGSNVTVNGGTLQTSNTGLFVVESYSPNMYSTVEFVIQVYSGANRHFTKVIVTVDSDNATDPSGVWITEKDTIVTNNYLGTFTAKAQSGAIQLFFSPASSALMTLKYTSYKYSNI